MVSTEPWVSKNLSIEQKPNSSILEAIMYLQVHSPITAAINLGSC